MKNIDYVIKKTASDLGLPENKVRHVILEYWKEGFQNIITFTERTTSFKFIGSFTVSKFKLDKFIEKRIQQLARTKESKKITEEKRAMLLEIYQKDLELALIEKTNIDESYKKFLKNELVQGLPEDSKSGNTK